MYPTRRLIASYENGNYSVKLYSDGTKIKETDEDSFFAAFPDSIDLKITDFCDTGCPMCHEMSSPDGKAGNLDEPFLSTLRAGTELAIGGGNPLSHPSVVPFLWRMKRQGVICNLTVNSVHLKRERELVSELIGAGLIHGLGISLSRYDCETVNFARGYPNAVLHLINGVFEDYEKIADLGLKVLLLGYKRFGRGEDFFSSAVEDNMKRTRELLPTILDRFAVISFDNLALSQLDVRGMIGDEEYEGMFMGEDGDASMYIDLVKREIAKSSTSRERFPLGNDIIPIFNTVRNK